jgi:hypothetical protein
MPATVFTPEKRRTFLELVMQGQTRMGAANAVGVSWSTIRSWMRNHPKYAARVRSGRKIIKENCEDTMYTLAMAGNFQALRFILLNLSKDDMIEEGDIKWMAENANITLTGKNGGPIEHYVLTREERLQRIAELIGKLNKESENSENLPKLEDLIDKLPEKEE